MTSWRQAMERAGLGALVLAAVAVALAVAWLVPIQPIVALGVAAVVLVAVAAMVNPVALPLLAMPLIVVVERVGVGGLDLTLSDAMLFLALWPAVLLAPRPLSRELRTLLWLNALYQVLTIFTLILNPFSANIVEWFHAWLLVSGSLIVGWAVGASGHARLGVALFLTACVALALPTIAQGLMQYARGDFGAVYPRWPWPMHKNFIGNLLGIAAVVVYARPRWLALPRRWVFPVLLIFVTAIAASQARQALVGLAIGLLVVSLRRHGERRRATIALAGVIPIVYVVITMVRDQIVSGNIHNSWFQRLDWYAESLRIWSESPLFGHGLRYWTQSGGPAAYQPPNAFVEVLASSGLVGLAGFLTLWTGLLSVLFRMNRAYGTLALALALSRLGQSQLDLFWVSVGVSVPFVLIGVCLGAANRKTDDGTSQLHSPDRRLVRS